MKRKHSRMRTWSSSSSLDIKKILVVDGIYIGEDPAYKHDRLRKITRFSKRGLFKIVHWRVPNTLKDQGISTVGAFLEWMKEKL